MAAISGMTLAQWDDLIDSEYIGRRAALAVSTPITYQLIANPIDISMQPTRTYAHVLRSHGTAATGVTETDAATSASVTSTEATVATTMVTKLTFVSYQAQGASVVDTAAAAIDFVVNACKLYIDDAFHGLSSSAANTIGSNATTMDLDNWVTMLTTYAGQAKNASGRAFVCSVDGSRDIQTEVLTSGAAILGSAAAAEKLFGAANTSMQGMASYMIGDVPVVITDEIPAADTTGWGNYFTTIGAENGALGLVVKRGIWVEMFTDITRGGIYFAGRADVGVGILDDNRCLQVVSKT